MKARICDRWDMELPESTTENKWWFDWAIAAPKHAGDHLTCSLRTFEAIAACYDRDEIDSIWEPFGGIGAHALMLEELFDPMVHRVADYASEAVEHMKRVLPPILVEQADAYDGQPIGRYDLFALDFGDLTVFKAQPGTPRGKLLDQVFGLQPKAVTITDIAARYLHLQKRSYEPLLGEGCCDSYEEYLERFSRLLEDRYGYVLLEGNYTRWSTVMAFVPEGVADHGTFHKLDPATAAPGLVIS